MQEWMKICLLLCLHVYVRLFLPVFIQTVTHLVAVCFKKCYTNKVIITKNKPFYVKPYLLQSCFMCTQTNGPCPLTQVF